MRAPLRQVAGDDQGYARQQVAEHERHRRSLGLRQCLELRRKLQRDRTVEGHAVGHPKSVEDRVGHKRVLRCLAQGFRLLDQGARPVECRLGLRRRMSPGMDQRIREIDLKLDLLAAQRWRARQRRDLAERA